MNSQHAFRPGPKLTVTRYLCSGCKAYSSTSLRGLRRHFYAKRSCQEKLDQELHRNGVRKRNKDYFYSEVEIRLGCGDREVGGQSHAQVRRPSLRPGHFLQSDSASESASLSQRHRDDSQVRALVDSQSGPGDVEEDEIGNLV
jgi:hypothetical protein